MTRRKKSQMQDLNEVPDENIDGEISKKETKERKNQRVNNAYNKRFSIFNSIFKTFLWMLLSVGLFIAMMWFINVITNSPQTFP